MGRNECPEIWSFIAFSSIKVIHFIFDQACLRSFYFAHIYFHLQYSILAWHNTLKQNLKKLESLHCKSVRLMTLHGPLQDFHFSAYEMFKNMNLWKTKDIYTLEMAKFMYRMHNNQLPETFRNYFIRIDSMHSYNLRSTSSRVFYSKHTYRHQYKNWFSNAGVVLWGNIDASLKNLSLKSFSSKLRNIIIESY